MGEDNGLLRHRGFFDALGSLLEIPAFVCLLVLLVGQWCGQALYLAR